MVIGAGAQAQEQFINALTIGAIYALIAIGYTMVYGIIELINFAHGEIFMVGSFVCWWLLTTLGFTGAIQDPVLLIEVLVLAFTVSMVVMGVVGVVIERLAYRPLRNAPRLAPLITAIGVSFILQNLVFVLISNSIVTVPQIIPNPVLDDRADRDPSDQPVRDRPHARPDRCPAAVHPADADGAGDAVDGDRPGRGPDPRREHQLHDRAGVLHRVRARGRGGRGARAVLRGHVLQLIGFQAGLKAFTAAVLGGIGNITGAAIGGFVIGFIEVLASVFGVGRWSEAAVFTTLVLVLIFRPTGILGQQLADRA